MDENIQSQHLRIMQESDVYSAAMLTYAWVQQAGAPALLATEAATVVSELGMNIVKYAGDGSLTLRLANGPSGYLDVLAQDRGPGIADVELALREHFSSRGTLGVGLPGVRRMCNSFQLRSSPGHGTTVHARRDFGSPAGAPQAATPPAQSITRMRSHSTLLDGWQHSVASRPCFGELVNGDGSALTPHAQGLMVALIDVLGHGEQAHRLARRCESWLHAHASTDVTDVLHALHEQFKGSIGAAITLAHLDRDLGWATVVGVGNTRLYTLGASPSRIDAQPGIVGGTQLPRLRPTRLRIAPGDVLVFATDGIRSQLCTEALQPMRERPAQVLAQYVMREYGVLNDDATCLVLRCLA